MKLSDSGPRGRQVSISIKDLRHLFATTIELLEGRYGETVALPATQYWAASLRSVVEARSSDNVELELGDVVDDIAELLNDGADGPAWHVLQHLSGLLAVLASECRPRN